MEAIFLTMFRMSITASWLIVAIIILRFILKKAPKNYFCILWGMVALRLLCPFSIESIFGIVPNIFSILEIQQNETLPPNHFIQSGNQNTDKNDSITNELESGGQGSVIPDSNVGTQKPNYPMKPNEPDNWGNLGDSSEANSKWSDISITMIATIIWIVGIVVLSLYSILSLVKLNREVRASLSIEKGVFICDTIRSPFILGMIFPKIYIPSDLSEEQMSCVMAHEQMHLKRYDHVWKPIGFVLLIAYWFNPLMWLAYILFCRDIEMACDEAVIQKMTHTERAMYVKTLIVCSSEQHRNLSYPLAFGEVGMKERVKVMMRYKKPSLKLMALAGIICVTVVACFGTSSSNDSNDESNTEENSTIESTEITTEESVEETTQDPFEGIEEQIEASDIVGRKFNLKGGLSGVIKNSKADFTIYIDEDGTFVHSVGHIMLSSGYAQYGLWEIDGSTLILRQTEYMSDDGKANTYCFNMKDGNLIFKTEGSDVFEVMGDEGELKNGATFIGKEREKVEYNPNDSFIMMKETIELSELVNRRYIYENESYAKFYIEIFENGTFTSSQGASSESSVSGTWEVSPLELVLEEPSDAGIGRKITVAVVTLKENGGAVNHFCMWRDNLHFMEEGSSNFAVTKVANGEIFFGEDMTGEPWGKAVFAENPFANIDETIELSDYAHSSFDYEGDGYMGYDDFYIMTYEYSGGVKFSLGEGYRLPYRKTIDGTCEVNGSILTLRSDDGKMVNHFYMRNGNLVFIEEGSTQFWSIKDVKNGEVFYGSILK